MLQRAPLVLVRFPRPVIYHLLSIALKSIYLLIFIISRKNAEVGKNIIQNQK